MTLSCGHKLDCEGFDVNESIMSWYIAPGLQKEVIYVDSNAVEYTFSQTSFAKSDPYTFKCGGFKKCACEPAYLNSSYSNSDLGVTFNTNAQYTYYPLIDLTYDSIPYSLNIDMDESLIQQGDPSLTVIALDTFTVFNTNYTKVFELTSTLEDFKFWVKKDVGMFAFEFNNSTYKLK